MLRPRRVRLSHCVFDFRPHGRTEKQIDQFGVELGSLPFADRADGFLETASMAVATAVRDCVEAVRDRDDAGS
jgi:hypothetical protein